MSESLLELCNGRKQPLLVTEMRGLFTQYSTNYHTGEWGKERGEIGEGKGRQCIKLHNSIEQIH